MPAPCPYCDKPPSLGFQANMAYDDHFYDCPPCEVVGPRAMDADKAEEAWDQWAQMVKKYRSSWEQGSRPIYRDCTTTVAARIASLEAEVERLRAENLELRAADRELIGYQRGIEEACSLMEELKVLARTPGQDSKRREWWDGAYWWVMTAQTLVRALGK